MRKGTFEYSMNIMFEYEIIPKISLSDENMLADEKFKVPFSIVFGDDDWMAGYDDGCSKSLINLK
jgi:hypothetical protein